MNHKTSFSNYVLSSKIPAGSDRGLRAFLLHRWYRKLKPALLVSALVPMSLSAVVVIDEDFSSGASDWTEVAGGTWTVSSGRYVLSSPGTAGDGLLGNIAIHDTSVSGDYTASGLIRITGTGSAWNDCVLVFGYQDSSNFYYASINESNDGYTHGIFKVVSGTPTELDDFGSLSISSDTDYDLEVVRSGSSIVVNLNSSQIGTATDSTFTGGQFGFGSKNDGGQFDDLLVDDGTVASGVTLDAGDGFYNDALASSQTGTFTAEFDATPSADPMDVVIGLSPDSATWYDDMAAIVRFNTSGNIDARDGGSYSADNTIAYDANTTYSFRLEINVSSKTYSAYVTPDGGSEQTIGSNYDFRSDQSSATYIDYWTAAVESSSSGEIELDNFSITASTQVAAPQFSPGGGTYTSTQNVTITTSTSGATIRYTTDGSTPTSTSGTVYSSAVAISSTTTLKAIAYKSGMTDSSVTSEVYTITTGGTSYYVDPSSGSMSNPGTSAQPWSTLEAVFSAGKTFSSGDTIYLRNGYHGFPTITGNPAGNVTIQPQSGHSPTAKKVIFNNASNFTLSDLEISPELVSSYEQGTFVTINSNCSDIVLSDCLIYSAASISGWSASDWTSKSGTGVSCSGEDCVITGNHILNTRFALNLNASAEYSEASYNTIENFAADGIRTLGNYQKIEYNLIMNAFNVDSNHDDGIQSWTVGAGGVGTGTLYGTEIRGNVIISYTDSGQPLKTTLQGIGCFDGFFEDWVVENNIVCVDQWHGIAFYGATDCKFVNNTVVENPIAAFSNTPWLGIFHHKTLGNSTGNLVRNNLVYDLNIVSGSATVDNNIETSSYTSHFVDYSNFDFHLKSSSSAVDAGSSNQAPSIDFEGDTRDSNPDIGADEY